jgi:WD40 repeat protein
MEDGSRVKKLPNPHKKSVTALAANLSDPSIFASGSIDGEIKIRNTKSGRCERTLNVNISEADCGVTALVFHQKKPNILFSGHKNGMICAWNILSGCSERCLVQFQEKKEKVVALGFDGQEDQLFVAYSYPGSTNIYAFKKVTMLLHKFNDDTAEAKKIEYTDLMHDGEYGRHYFFSGAFNYADPKIFIFSLNVRRGSSFSLYRGEVFYNYYGETQKNLRDYENIEKELCYYKERLEKLFERKLISKKNYKSSRKIKNWGSCKGRVRLGKLSGYVFVMAWNPYKVNEFVSACKHEKKVRVWKITGMRKERCLCKKEFCFDEEVASLLVNSLNVKKDEQERAEFLMDEKNSKTVYPGDPKNCQFNIEITGNLDKKCKTFIPVHRPFIFEADHFESGKIEKNRFNKRMNERMNREKIHEFVKKAFEGIVARDGEKR